MVDRQKEATRTLMTAMPCPPMTNHTPYVSLARCRNPCHPSLAHSGRLTFVRIRYIPGSTRRELLTLTSRDSLNAIVAEVT